MARGRGFGRAGRGSGDLTAQQRVMAANQTGQQYGSGHHARIGKGHSHALTPKARKALFAAGVIRSRQAKAKGGSHPGQRMVFGRWVAAK